MKKIVSVILIIYLFSYCNEAINNDPLIKRQTIVIGIRPYENFDRALIDTLQISIKQIYGFKTVVLPHVSMPVNAFVDSKSPRYRADTLIRVLKREKPDTIDFIIGLTDLDISTTKRDNEGNIKKPEYKYKDWGVFGLGFVSGPSCIVSTYRLKSDKSKFVDRFKKVCIHELGHNLGLKHCTYQENCVMSDANETIKTIDNEDLMLCKRCKSLIRH